MSLSFVLHSVQFGFGVSEGPKNVLPMVAHVLCV